MHVLGSLALREVVLLLQLLVQLALGSILQDQEHPLLHVQRQRLHSNMPCQDVCHSGTSEGGLQFPTCAQTGAAAQSCTCTLLVHSVSNACAERIAPPQAKA